MIQRCEHVDRAAEAIDGRRLRAREQRLDLATRFVGDDVGQSLAVLGSDVLAVEAIEGTDAMIDRAGTLAKGRAWTLFKTSASNHDRRGDVPVIGPQTVVRVAQNGGKTIAIGAGRVILLEAEKVRAEADRFGVRLVGF